MWQLALQGFLSIFLGSDNINVIDSTLSVSSKGILNVNFSFPSSYSIFVIPCVGFNIVWVSIWYKYYKYKKWKKNKYLVHFN